MISSRLARYIVLGFVIGASLVPVPHLLIALIQGDVAFNHFKAFWMYAVAFVSGSLFASFGILMHFRLSWTEAELMRKEGARQESEDRFKIAFETNPDAITITEIESGKILDVNDGFVELSGYTKEESVGKTVYELEVWSDMYDRGVVLDGLLQDGVVKNFETLFRVKRGEQRYGSLSARVIQLNNKYVILAIIRDVDQERRSELKIRESEEKYRTLTENLNLGVTRYQSGVGFVEVNPAMIMLFGYEDREDFLGKNMDELICDVAERQRFNQKIQQEGFVRNEEVCFLKKDGSTFIASISAVVTQSSEEEGVVYYDGVIEDVTERKQLERQLRTYTEELEQQVRKQVSLLSQQERKAVLGMLAGSVAHDINNPLQYVLGSAEIMETLLDKEEPAKLPPSLMQFPNLVEHIIDGCVRIRETIGRLKRVSGQRPQRTFDLYESLNTALAMTEVRWRYVVDEVSTDFQAPAPLLIFGVENDIIHVFLNLLINAIQSMEGKEGVLGVCVRIVEAMAEVAITDSGGGIPEDIKSQIGRESVTTKSPSEGTGLGLLSVFDIVRAHKGLIGFESNDLQGTTFTVRLPLLQERRGNSG